MKKIMILITSVVLILLATGCNGETENENNSNNGIPNNGGEIINTDAKLFQEIINSNERSVIYVGRPTCPACNRLYPVIEEVAKEVGINFFYTNLDEWNRDDMSDILFATLRGVDSTPTIVVIDNGEIIDKIVGGRQKDYIINFLRNNNVID